MRRELGQLSLADGLVEGGAGRNRELEQIAALVDWAAFERLLGAVYAAPVGRPSYGPVVLLISPCSACGVGHLILLGARRASARPAAPRGPARKVGAPYGRERV